MPLPLAIVSTVVIWASAFPGIRAGLESYGPAHLGAFRFLVASLVLACIAMVRGVRPLARKDAVRMFLSGAVGIAVYNACLNVGELTVPSGVASLLVNTAPIWTSLFAAAVLRERPTALVWTGTAVAFSGVALIALGGEESIRFGQGAVLILGSALAHSLYIILQKPMLKKYGVVTATSMAVWTGTLCLLPFAGGLWEAVRSAPPSATAIIVYLGIGPAAVAYLTWGSVLDRLPASRAASFLYLIPLTAFLIAWIWLGEVPSGRSLLGAAFVLTGVALVNHRRRKIADL